MRAALAGLLLLVAVGAATLAGQEPATTAPFGLPPLGNLESSARALIEERWRSLQSSLADAATTTRVQAESWSRLGNVLHAHELLESADECYLQARRLDPDEPRWTYFSAVVSLEQADLEGAASGFEEVISQQPDHLPSHLRRASALIELGRAEDARAAWNRALELEPGNAAATCGLGRLALLAGDLAPARERLESCLRVQPEATRVHAQLATVYRRLGDPERSREHAARYGSADVVFADPWIDDIRRAQSPAELHLAEANRALLEGRDAVAERSYRAALDVDPDNLDAIRGLASLLTQRGDEQASLEWWRRAIELEPSDPLPHFNLGSLYARSQSWGSAERHYREVLRLDPGDHEALRHLAVVLERGGRGDEAVETWRGLVAAKPADVDLTTAYARALTRSGRCDEGRVALSNGLAVVPADRGLRYVLARLLSVCNEPPENGERAVELALALFEEQPSPQHAETVAMAHAAAGDFETAQRWQAELLGEAERQGLRDWMERSRKLLERYQAGLRAPLEIALDGIRE